MATQTGCLRAMPEIPHVQGVILRSRYEPGAVAADRHIRLREVRPRLGDRDHLQLPAIGRRIHPSCLPGTVFQGADDDTLRPVRTDEEDVDISAIRVPALDQAAIVRVPESEHGVGDLHDHPAAVGRECGSHEPPSMPLEHDAHVAALRSHDPHSAVHRVHGQATAVGCHRQWHPPPIRCLLKARYVVVRRLPEPHPLGIACRASHMAAGRQNIKTEGFFIANVDAPRSIADQGSSECRRQRLLIGAGNL